MPFEVTLADEIAATRNWTGTRRRTCTMPGGEKQILVFGRKPVLLAELPPEVVADKMLVVKEVAAPPLAVESDPEPNPDSDPEPESEPESEPTKEPAPVAKKFGKR